MKMYLSCLGVLCCCLAAVRAEGPAAAPVKPREVRTVRADGRHNAFTAMRRYRDQLWLAFRSGTTHNTRDGDVLLLRSADDGKSWTQALRLDLAPDDRDPQLLVLGKRLFLYEPAIKGSELVSHVTCTQDGKTWSKPSPAYLPQYILWKPCVHQGKVYAAAHRWDNTSGGKGREVHLIVSDDGLSWQKVSTVRAGNWESETTLYFDEGGKATAFLRQKYGSPPCEVLESEPPWATWKARHPGVTHLSGHSVHTFGGTTYLLSRTMDPTRKAGCMVYTYEGGKPRPYCQLPAGGDGAYADAVEAGDAMLVSYYSSHEGPTNIYLAVVPLKK